MSGTGWNRVECRLTGVEWSGVEKSREEWYRVEQSGVEQSELLSNTVVQGKEEWEGDGMEQESKLCS